MQKEPLVSISYITYNQIAFVERAINGFLIQKTEFPFEIYIHDDASTDGTAELLHEYEMKYPDVIRVVFEKENQYSKRGHLFQYCIMPYINSKYIAHCDGDDYWTDPYKLQKQVTYLENHPDCSGTCHASNYVIDDVAIANCKRFYEECDIPVEILIQNAGFTDTSTLCYRTCIGNLFPKFRQVSPSGDYALQILLGLCGRFHYFPDVMSSYRWESLGSWTADYGKDADKHKKILLEEIYFLQELDEETKGKYQSEIHGLINSRYEVLYTRGYCKLEEIYNIEFYKKVNCVN